MDMTQLQMWPSMYRMSFRPGTNGVYGLGAPASSSSYLLPSRKAWKYHSPFSFIHFNTLSVFQSLTLIAPLTPLPDTIHLYSIQHFQGC